MGDFIRITSSLYTSKHLQREIWLSQGVVEFIWAPDGGLWGDRWVICHPKRVIGLEE